jgi:alkanesulfonate monooxygenase SsuD/methylene tetrahydromethanopterin reductase-like flavin-dependent oxidoreductase (luciferase family)
VRTDVFFFGTVPMDDAGAGGPLPTDRRYSDDVVQAAYANQAHWAQTADRLGYDTFWSTEHHFQHEGYEVIPNLIMLGVALAARTSRIRFGQMFNVVPQWHPLRLAEDFAMADILTGGRMVFGVGRGTVPREAESLGTVVASGDNEMSREADRINREVFEESMEIVKAAWGQERFSFTGKHFELPPTGIPDRGSTVSELTLVPRPRGTVEIYQPISSPDTLEYAPAVGHKGVFWLGAPASVAARWERYGEIAAEHGRSLRRGEDRALVLNTFVGRTRADAFAAVRDGHDEFIRFLAPYGRFTSYLEDDGLTRKPFGYAPPLEESVRQRIMAIGSVDDVVDAIGAYAEELGLEHLVIFPEFPGLTREQVDEQLHLVAEEILPRVVAA